MSRKRAYTEKRPSFQFYPSDWLRDIALRCVSLQARGLWMDMLCYMHEGQPYGYLKVNHKVILSVNLSHMTGVNLEVIEVCLKELLEAGVCSRAADGSYYSRRMVRDEEIRQKRAQGGVLGGNPVLKKGEKKDNHKVNLIDNHRDNLSPEDEYEDEKEEVEKRKEGIREKRKRKPKSQKIMVAPDVHLTPEENQRLVEEYGEVFCNQAYNLYANWKIEKGVVGTAKDSKDDNLTIRRWVIDATREKFYRNGESSKQNITHGRKPTGAELLAAKLRNSASGESFTGNHANFGIEIQPGITLFPNEGG